MALKIFRMSTIMRYKFFEVMRQHPFRTPKIKAITHDLCGFETKKLERLNSGILLLTIKRALGYPKIILRPSTLCCMPPSYSFLSFGITF